MKGRMRTALLGMLAGFVLGVGVSGAAYALGHPENVVKYRLAVQQSLGRIMRAMGDVVKGKVSFTSRLPDQALALNLSSKGLVEMFPAGTGADKLKTRARPEIWRDWDTFRATAEKLVAETAKLVEVSKSGDFEAFTAQYKAVGKVCSACHKPFRTPLRKKK